MRAPRHLSGFRTQRQRSYPGGVPLARGLRRARRAARTRGDSRCVLRGAIIKLVDRDQAMTHPQFRRKLEAVGYGLFEYPSSSSRRECGSISTASSRVGRRSRACRSSSALFARRARPAGVALQAARDPRTNGRRRTAAGDVAQLPRGRRPDRRAAGSDPPRHVCGAVAAGLLWVLLFRQRLSGCSST